MDVEKAFMYNLHDCCLLLAKFMQTSFEIQSNTPHADFCSAGVLRKEIENITKNSSLLPFKFFLICDRTET